MRTWGLLILLAWLVSLGGTLVCAVTKNYTLGSGLFVPLACVAFGQSFMAATIKAIRSGTPVLSRRRIMWVVRARYFTRQRNPYRYWFATTTFMLIGVAATLLGIWLFWPR